MTQSLTGTGMTGAVAPASRRVARWAAALCLALGSSGCLLTSDLPDPALDVPPGYKAAGTKNPTGCAADARLVARLPLERADAR